MTPHLNDGPPVIRIGSRGSALALAQVDAVVRRLTERFPHVVTETAIVATQGDIDKVTPLTEIGGRGVFTNALERELAHGQIDVAVHSAKDLPSSVSSELPIVAFPEREDPRDVLVSRHGVTLAELPPSPVIGTSSRRREAQVRRLRPDARIVSLRGNIDTRLRKATQTEYDAIILAAAGLSRMGWVAQVSESFSISAIVPAPGQGALAVQTASHSPWLDHLAALDDPRVSVAVQAERAFLAAIGAGCTMPVGAHVHDGVEGLAIVAFLESESGDRNVFRQENLEAANPAEHAALIAREMQAEVGEAERRQWTGASIARPDLAGVTVAVTRPTLQAQSLIQLLHERGATPLALPTIRIEPPRDRAPLYAALRALAAGAFTWVVFTSANGVEAVASAAADLGARDECLRAIRAATIGEATARAALDLGLDVAIISSEPTAEGLAASLVPRLQAGDRVLYPRSAIGRDVLPAALREAGIDITTVDAYRTVPETSISPDVLACLRSREVDLILFASPSSVSSLQTLLGNERSLIDHIPAICAGPVTAAAVREAGLPVALVSTRPGSPALVDAVAEYWLSRGPDLSSMKLARDEAQNRERIAGR